MAGDRGPGAGGPIVKKRSLGNRGGGEQFSDPLACPPDMRPPPGPPERGGHSFEEEDLKREREINKRILATYGQSSWIDALKPLLGLALIGAIAFSQVSKANMGNAIIYTAMFMAAAGAVYTLFARDTLPPLLSIILKGCFALGLLVVGIWVVANHSDYFTPRDKDGKSTYRHIQEEVVSPK